MLLANKINRLAEECESSYHSHLFKSLDLHHHCSKVAPVDHLSGIPTQCLLIAVNGLWEVLLSICSISTLICPASLFTSKGACTVYPWKKKKLNEDSNIKELTIKTSEKMHAVIPCFFSGTAISTRQEPYKVKSLIPDLHPHDALRPEVGVDGCELSSDRRKVDHLAK